MTDLDNNSSEALPQTDEMYRVRRGVSSV